MDSLRFLFNFETDERFFLDMSVKSVGSEKDFSNAKMHFDAHRSSDVTLPMPITQSNVMCDVKQSHSCSGCDQH